MNFEINNDLNRIRLSYHNFTHLLGSFILAVLFSFWWNLYGFFWSYGLWFLYEIFDGFKPWYYSAPYKIRTSKFPSVNWFKKEFLYSDKFSLQDILIWNLSGALSGTLFGTLLKYFLSAQAGLGN